MITSIPLVDGVYPVTPVGLELNPQLTTSVAAAPVAVVVTVDAQAPEPIELVPSAEVPATILTASTPDTACNVLVTVPNAPVGGDTVMLPDVALACTIEPTDEPATPRFRTDVPSVVMPAATFGAEPAPPPSTRAFDVNAADEAIVDVALK